MFINIHHLSQLFNCSLKHMKPKVNIFDGKKKNAISTVCYLAVVRFLKPVFKEILNNSYVSKAAIYVEYHGFNRNCFAQMTNECESSF